MFDQVSLCDFASGDLGVEAALNQIFAEAKSFCKNHSLQLHMQGLTRILVGYQNTSAYPTGFLS